MKIKDFIKILQEADPSGEAHIRMEGGIPYSAELKEGYWDGCYTYIDEDGKYVTSAQGMKVDIHTMDISDFIERKYYSQTKWEDIEKCFKFEINNYCDEKQRNERKDRVLKEARENFDELEQIHLKLFNEGLEKNIQRAKDGWKWFQNKDVDKNEKPNMHIYYTWRIYDENGKQTGSNIHLTESVMFSGKFKKIDGTKEGYYEWVLNEEL